MAGGGVGEPAAAAAAAAAAEAAAATTEAEAAAVAAGGALPVRNLVRIKKAMEACDVQKKMGPRMVSRTKA